jgi:hypothetical protein
LCQTSFLVSDPTLEKLKNSKYGTEDSVNHITKRFDETTKRLFRDRKEPQYIPFGSPLDKDATVGIRGGQLKLTGYEPFALEVVKLKYLHSDEVAELFEPSVQAAVSSIKAQIDASAGSVKVIDDHHWTSGANKSYSLFGWSEGLPRAHTYSSNSWSVSLQ